MLSTKYAKLRGDLIVAMEAGKRAEAEAGPDRGTCNFDSPVVVLRGFQNKRVLKVMEDSGIYAFKVGTSTYEMSPHTQCQGIPRTKNAEAIRDKLKELGYESYVRYMMD